MRASPQKEAQNIEVSDNIWLVSFIDYDLGFFDEEVGRVEPTSNPFIPKL